MADQILKLGCAHVRIDRYQRDAERVQRKPMQEEARAIFHEDADPIAGAIALCTIGVGQRPDPSARFAIADLAR